MIGRRLRWSLAPALIVFGRVPSPAGAAPAAEPFDFNSDGYTGVPGESMGEVEPASAVKVSDDSRDGATKPVEPVEWVSGGPRSQGRSRSARLGAAVWAGSFTVLALGSWRPAWSGDEAATVLVVRRSWAGVVRTFTFDPALEPFYVFLKLWSVPSTSEWWLRLPSVLAVAGAAAALSVLTTRLAGRRAGLLAALVMLALPATSRYAQDARPYGLSVLIAILAVICWDSDRMVSRRRQVALALAVAVVGLVQAYALLILPLLVCASWLAPRISRRREVITTSMSCVAGVLLISPFLYVVDQRAKGQADPPMVTAAHVAEEVLRLPAGVLSPPLALPLALGALGLAAAGIVVGWRRHGLARRGAVLAALWVCLPPVALCLFQVATGSPGLVARYWTFCLPAIALAASLALDALWSRSRAMAAGCVVLLIGLGAPTQVSIRGVDGHLGRRWRDFPQVLAQPALRTAPLLAEGWSYRALVSNEPAIGARMPLLLDPTVTGRVNPEVVGPDSDAFQVLTRDHDLVVVLQAERGFASALPTRRSFRSVGPELRIFPTAAVLCAYFGEPLGVFTKTRDTLAEAEAKRLAEQITAIQPGNIRCHAPSP